MMDVSLQSLDMVRYYKLAHLYNVPTALVLINEIVYSFICVNMKFGGLPKNMYFREQVTSYTDCVLSHCTLCFDVVFVDV